MNKRPVILTIIVILVIAGLALAFGGLDAVRGFLAGQAKAQPAGAAAKGGPRTGRGADVNTIFAVNTTKAVKGQIVDYIELNGDVETKSVVDIYADTIGKLSKLNIQVGDRIEKDQIIAEVDPSKPGMKFVPSPVKSPVEGTVTAIPVYLGATISTQTAVARITSVDQLQIRTTVAERYISKIRIGLDAVVAFDAYPDARFNARVTETAPVVDPATRTMEVKLKLNTPNQRVKAGMFAKIKVVTERKNNIVKVPADAVVKRFGDYYVFVVTPNKESETGFAVDRRKVMPGIQIDEKLEIDQGLKPDEEIVIQGQTLLDDKSRIKIVGKVPPLAPAHTIQ